MVVERLPQRGGWRIPIQGLWMELYTSTSLLAEVCTDQGQQQRLLSWHKRCVRLLAG